MCAANPTAAPAMPLPAAEGHKLLREKGLYLPLLRELQAIPDPRDFERDSLAQTFALIGDEDSAFAANRGHPWPAPKGNNFRAESAIDRIVEAAKSRQIVILNEAHMASRCRAFAQALVERLHAVGFNIFTAETLFNEPALTGVTPADVALNSGGAVTTSVGYYVADPVYAEMIRSARAHHYSFAVYEARQDQMNAREEAEADNFVANILAKNPKSRVFAYCGYGHVVKKGWATFSPFAALLKAKTGIDPLCITQAEGLPAPDPSSDSDMLKWALDRFSPTVPVVITGGYGEPAFYSREQVDFVVVHPRLSKVDGRPGWLAGMPDRRRTLYALQEAVAAYALIQAIPIREAAAPNVIPADQYPVPAGTRDVVFFLKPGKYEVRIETDAGRRVLGNLTV